MMILTTVLILAANLQVAQGSTPAPASTTAPIASPSGATEFIDTRGPCLESARQVPNVIGEPVDRSSEIVRIDKVLSNATYTPNQIIGFLYTRQDGKTFLGMRSPLYTSAASAQELNQVLASTHAPGVTETGFPPQTRLGVKTGYAQFFEVKIPPNAFSALQIRLDPCVVWPAGRPLPDPAPGP